MIEFGPKLERVIIDYDDAFLTCLTFDHHGCYDWRLPTTAEYFNNSLKAGVWYETKTKWCRSWYVIPVREAWYVIPVRDVC
jgi:hypothetical protein